MSIQQEIMKVSYHFPKLYIYRYLFFPDIFSQEIYLKFCGSVGSVLEPSCTTNKPSGYSSVRIRLETSRPSVSEVPSIPTIESSLTKTLPRRAPIYDESKYQKSVRVRSARERSRALAWMQKVAHREEDVDYSYQPVCDRIQGPAAGGLALR